jgi:hypothetical protein
MRFIVRPARDGRKPGAREFPAFHLIACRFTDHSTLLGNLVTHSRDFH